MDSQDIGRIKYQHFFPSFPWDGMHIFVSFLSPISRLVLGFTYKAPELALMEDNVVRILNLYNFLSMSYKTQNLINVRMQRGRHIRASLCKGFFLSLPSSLFSFLNEQRASQ